MYSNFAKGMGFDPMEASGTDIVIWLVQRSKETSSPNIVQSDLQAIKCFPRHTNKPLGDIALVAAVTMSLLNKMEANDLN